MTRTEPMHINPADENYWAGIRAQYAIPDDFINLENGYFGMPAKPVLDAFQRYNALANREATYFMRTKFPDHLNAAVKALADFTGAAEQELAITRNATESMNILIQGYPYAEGDELIFSNHEYDSVIETLQMMQQRRRVKLVRVCLPFHPRHDDEIVALYENAIAPHTRVIVLTHMLHRTGMVLPVAKIAAMARAHGVDVLLDAAHSFAQLDYLLPELSCDFVAANLHKWLGAPLGTGLLYVCKERIPDIAPLFGCTMYDDGDIRKLARFNTMPPAAILAVEDAIAFHRRIGGANKEARLRYLKDYWTDRVKGFRRIELLTPDAPPGRACAIAAFRVAGLSAQEVVDSLFEQHRIFTVATGFDDESMVRVTPYLYNTTAELDCLVAALDSLA